VYGGVYGRLTADAAGRYLLGDSLNGLRVLGEQRIRNQSPAWYGTVNWHPIQDLTVTTGLRTTYEDRTTSAYRLIIDNGYAGVLNPTRSSFGVNLGGFDSIFVSAAGAGGYNAIGPDGQWHTYDYNKTFNPATDVNTYVVNNKIVEKSTWLKAGKPNTATSYATNDAFYTNGRKLGLGTDVSKAFTAPKVGTTNATKATMPTSDVIRVQVNTASLTTSQDGYKAALRQANAAAFKYFGKRSSTDPTTGVTTQAWDQLTAAQQRQIADAQNLRKAQIGVIYNSMTAQPFRELQLTSVISPMYKINEDLNAYVTWQRGESAGIAQIVNGVSMQAKPQTTNNYEIGLKSFLFNKTLTLNTDFFFMNIDQYQQAVQVVDSYTTELMNDGNLYYTSATLNAEQVQAWGFEFDGAYTGIPDTTLRFAGAYNDAWYEKFPNSPLAPEQDPNSPQYKDHPFQDLSGRTLPGASRFMFNVGGEYRHVLPYFETFEGHTALNYAFQTGYNADVTLSKYGWINGYGLLDFSAGIGLKNRLVDVTFLARNLLDTTPIASNAAAGVMQTTPRFLGVVISGQF
jgi:outer membrane receptor protein involved in Fe transport